MNLCRSAGRELRLEKTKALKCGLKMLESNCVNQWILIKQNLGVCGWLIKYAMLKTFSGTPSKRKEWLQCFSKNCLEKLFLKNMPRPQRGL